MRPLILCKIVKPRVRSRSVADETRLIESNGGSARSEDHRRNVHMAQQCTVDECTRMQYIARVLRGDGWWARGEGRRGCRGRGEDFVISVTPFGRCIMSVAVLGHYWQADPTIFRSSNRFLRGRAGGEAAIRHMFTTWASFPQKRIQWTRGAGRARELPAMRSTRRSSENTWRRNRRSIPVATAANSRRFCSPLFAPVARDRRHGSHCLCVVWECKNSSR